MLVAARVLGESEDFWQNPIVGDPCRCLRYFEDPCYLLQPRDASQKGRHHCSQGARLLISLSAATPSWLNPIKIAYSKFMEHLCRSGAITFEEMFDALAEICDLYTAQGC